MTGPPLASGRRAAAAGPPWQAATVPAGLAAAAIAAQIVYPLADVSARDRLTVVVVITFAGASLTHAGVRRGWRFAGWLLAVAGGVGAAAELVGVATGWPFGAYRYTGDLGPAVGGVPVIIPLAWTMMAYPALVIARHVTRRPVAGVVLAACALTAWDLFLDPQMVAHGQWEWAAGDAYLGVPASNYAGWLATSLVIAAALWAAADRAEARGQATGSGRRGDAVPVVLYAWTWVGSVVAHAVFFDLGRSAVVGGVGMGAVMVAWVVSAWSAGTRRG